MKNFFIIIILSMLAVVLQTSLIADILSVFFGFIHLTKLAYIKINLLLITVVYLSLQRNMLEGILLASILGYFLNLFSPLHLGLHSLIFALTFLIVKTTSSKIYLKASFMNVVWVFIATIVSNMLILLAYSTTETFGNFSISFLKMLIPEAFLNALAAPIIFKILKVIDIITNKTMDDEDAIKIN